MRSTAAWALILLSILTGGAFAQNQPPDTMQYCFSGECFRSRGEAEAAMRASWQHGELLKEASAATSWKYFNGKYQDVVTVHYKAEDQPPLEYFDAAYSNGWSTEDCVKSNNPDYPNLCVSEAEAVRVWWENIHVTWPNCQHTNPRMSGINQEPYQAISNVRGNNSRGIITYGSERFFRYETWCPGWDSEERSPRHLQIGKRRTFTCPADFTVINARVDRNPVAFPKLCRSSVGRSITMAIKQVASCPANQNPCHPATGNKSRADVDFTFAGRPFVRHYNSLRQFPTTGAGLGVGWGHTYAMRGNGRHHVIDADGSYDDLAGIGSRTYAAKKTVGRFYRELPDYSGELHEPNGDIKYFDPAGVMTAIANPERPETDVTLIYSPASGSTRTLVGVVDRRGRSISFERDPSGVINRIVLPDGAVVAYGYDEVGNLTSVDYGNGNVRRYLYGEDGAAVDRHALTGIVSEEGQRFATFRYDEWGRVTYSGLHASGGMADVTELVYLAGGEVEVETKDGTRRYTFDDSVYRHPLAVRDAAGSVTYLYSGERLVSRTGASGAVTSYEHEPLQISRIIYGAGTPSQYTVETDRDAEFNRITERQTRDASGTQANVVSTPRNSRGQVVSFSQYEPMTGVTRTGLRAYCEQPDVDAGTCPSVGLLVARDDSRTDIADITQYTYYPADAADCATSSATCAYRKGDLWKVTNALGQTTETLRYDGAGRVLSVRDANGVVTDMEYHPRGWLTASKVRGPDASTETDDLITRIDYEPTGLVKRTTLPDGSYTAFSYDAAHRLTGISDGQGNRIVYTLDNAGNRTKEETIGHDGTVLRTLSRVFNQLGQLKTQRDAYQSATHYTYDANGNVDQVTDALGRVTQQDYDPLNRLTRTVQDVGGIEAATELRYDALDRLTAVVDPKGLTTGYAYNGLGDLLELSSPDTGTSTYGYDSAGNRTSQTDARGITTTYSYDALNRLTGVQYPTTGLDVTYTYDLTPTACDSSESYSVGRLTGLSDASGSTQYCYDRFGRLVRKVQTTSGQVFVLRYAYTMAGQLSAIQYPDGTVADYVRDGQGRVTEVGVTRPDHLREVLLTDAHHYPFGPVQQWTFGNGRTLLRVLDQNYAPGAIDDGAGGLSLGFEFDAAGNLSTLRDGALSDPPQALFDYDGLNRLTQVQDGPTGTPIDIYAYDATGNRTSVTRAAGQTDYTYDATSHRLQAVGPTTRQYDAAGNTIAIGSRQFVYNDAGRLAQVNGAQTASYTYNGKGEQVRRSSGADNRTFVYDEAGQWLGAYGTDGTPIQQVIWLDNLPVGVIEAGQLHYIEPDHLGTPRAIIEPQRNVVVWKWDLTGEAFGETPPKEDVDGDGHAFVFDLRFPGQRYDAASGLNYNYFRDYETSTGRYVESDPIGLKGDIATYSYAANKPQMFYDADGLEPIAPMSCLGGRGVVTCDGNGGYEKRLCSTTCTASCTAAHEDQHLADLRAMFPSKCRGKRRGENPYQREDMGPNGEYPLWWYQLECRGDRAGKKCAENLLSGKSSMCAGPECESEIRNYIYAIDARARRYRCQEYGW